MDHLSAECVAHSVGPGTQLITLLIQTLISSYCNLSSSNNWPKDYGTEIQQNGLDDYDFVIVGAGSAGSVIANRLSENPEWKILLLEAGGDPPIESEIPLIFFSLQHTKSDWQYYAQPNKNNCQGSNGGVCFWPRGKTMGGSGAVNAMLYVRGNRKDFDSWQAQGNPTWGYDDVLEYFKKSENIQTKLPYNEKEHGKNGPMKLDHFTYNVDKTAQMVFDAAKELGHQILDDFSESQGFVGYSKVLATIQNGRRASSAKAFLGMAKDRPNLHVIKHAQVMKINFDKSKAAKSVQFIYKNQTEMTVKLRKEVILSAGSIGSPQILMLSGIGPEKHLKKLSIPVVKSLSVGHNLQDHAIVPLIFKIRQSNPKSLSDKEMLTEIFKFVMNETSLFSELGLVDIVGFVNTKDPNGIYPDIEYHHFVFYQNDPNLLMILAVVGYSAEIQQNIIEANKNSEIMMIWTVLLNPKSVGTIRLASADYRDHPHIKPNYFHESEDKETILRGMKIQLKFLQTKSFQENEIELVQPNLPDCQSLTHVSDKYWKCYMKYMSGTVYHPTGTCKMGPKTDRQAVVDPQLNVYGVTGLRVGDASIMPDVVSGNTNAATIMIGEKLSDFVKNQWSTDVAAEEQRDEL